MIMVIIFFRQALLEQQLAVERGKMETEKKKFQHAMDEKVRNSPFDVLFNSALDKNSTMKHYNL